MEEKKDNLENVIHPLNESLYIECIFSATVSAINSLEEVNYILSNPDELENFGLKTIDMCKNIVIQAGIISKYFKPSRNKGIHKLRGEKLRQSYKILDDNFLLDRGFRDHIEHFDEKLDVFLKDSIIGEVFPKKLFYSSKEISSITIVFKGFVINESKLISLGKEIEIVPLMKEIYAIHDLCIEFIKNGSRLG